MTAERFGNTLLTLGLFAAIFSIDHRWSITNILMGVAVLIGFIPGQVIRPIMDRLRH
jgi:hypothetical protein